MRKIKEPVCAHVILLLTLTFNASIFAAEEQRELPHQTNAFASSSMQFMLPLSGESLDIVHPCTDYGFKRAFHDQQVACGFLNTVLGISGTEEITHVRFLDKELPSHELLGRDFIVDILCETGKGRRFLIEMQNDFRADYATKAFTEFCRLIAHWDAEVIHQEVAEESRKRARASTTYDGVKEFWRDIKTAIVLVVTNKRFSHDQRKERFLDHAVMEPDIINSYRMTHERVPGRPLGDLDARVILVMLGNFNKTEDELTSPLDQWLYAFKDETLASGVSRIPTYKHIENIHRVGVDSNPGIASFYNILNKEVVRIAGDLESFEKNIAEVNGMLEVMEEKKRLEGRVEGRDEREREIAIEMIKDGEPESKILKYAKITAERLQIIKDSMEA
jgi:hypothetical protein